MKDEPGVCERSCCPNSDPCANESPQAAGQEEEEELEEWEKEELAEMWKFQGKCDAAKIMREQEQKIQQQNREIKRMCEELRTRKEPAPSQQFGCGHGVGSEVSEGKVRFIQKFCMNTRVLKMEEDGISAKEAAQD